MLSFPRSVRYIFKSSMNKDILQKLRKFDAYSKPQDEVRIKTITGAVLTLTGVLITILLFLSEIKLYLSPNISEELFVDTSRGPQLRINLDIIVPSISCDYLALDAMDSSGEQHLKIDHNIYKRRLSLEGQPIEDPKKEEIATTTPLMKKKEEKVVIPPVPEEVKCGSCYGAQANDTHCCNTCEDVREAYKMKRWAIRSLEHIEQCKNEVAEEKLKAAFVEGCQIYGYMEVNRVGGSFHVAPGQSFSLNHVHIHDVQPYSSSSFNTTHNIRHLSFGANIQSASTSPLDNSKGIATEGATMFQYYIKIVPTMYKKLDGTQLFTNQFSVTRHQKSVTAFSGESGMPGIFFSYELSPLMVKYTEKERSFGHLLTSICAIVGGVFTVAGVLDIFLYHSIKAIQNKIELGKAS